MRQPQTTSMAVPAESVTEANVWREHEPPWSRQAQVQPDIHQPPTFNFWNSLWSNRFSILLSRWTGRWAGVRARAPIFARLGGPASAPLRFLTELLPHTFVKRWPKRILTSNSCLSDSGRHECKLRFTRSLHDLTRLAHHPVRGSTWTTMLKGMFCQSPLQPNPV